MRIPVQGNQSLRCRAPGAWNSRHWDPGSQCGVRGPWPGLPSAVKSPAAQQTLRTWGLPAGPACLILTTGQVPESWLPGSGSPPPVLRRPLSTRGKSDRRQGTPGPDARTRPRPACRPPRTLAGLFGVREGAWSRDEQPLKVPLLLGGPRGQRVRGRARPGRPLSEGGALPKPRGRGALGSSLERSRPTSLATAGGAPARSSRDVPVLERPPTCFHFPRGMQRAWTCGRSSSFRLLERSAAGGGLNVALTALEAGSPRWRAGVLGKSNPPPQQNQSPWPPCPPWSVFCEGEACRRACEECAQNGGHTPVS